MLARPSAATAAMRNGLMPPASLALTSAPQWDGYNVGHQVGHQVEGSLPSLQMLSACAALSSGVSVVDAKDMGYPPFALSALESAQVAAEKAKREEGKMTCDTVHELMVERLGLSPDEAKRANPCLKRGILLGHIILSPETTISNVVCEGRCISCGKAHSATIADVLHQPTYGGNDYCDGGEGAPSSARAAAGCM